MARDLTRIKNKDTGMMIPITEMDSPWLDNLINYFQKNGRTSDELYPVLLVEEERRRRLSINIPRPPRSSAIYAHKSKPYTPSVPYDEATAVKRAAMVVAPEPGTLRIEAREGRQLRMLRDHDALSMVLVSATNVANAYAVVEGTEAVRMALEILQLFNEDKMLATIAEQFAPEPPIVKKINQAALADCEAW